MAENNIFAKRFRQLRLKKNISVPELSRQLGKSPSTVLRWDNGERIPNSTSLTEIGNFFGVSPEWLLGNTDNMKTDKFWTAKKDDTVIRAEDLYRFRGEPVWISSDTGGEWALVAKNEDVLFLSDGRKIPFYKIKDIITRNPSPLCYGIDSMENPIPLGHLIDYQRVWVEEIGPDPTSKRRGWYNLSKDKNRYIGQYGDMFEIKDYGVRWVAFCDIC